MVGQQTKTTVTEGRRPRLQTCEDVWRLIHVCGERNKKEKAAGKREDKLVSYPFFSALDL